MRHRKFSKSLKKSSTHSLKLYSSLKIPHSRTNTPYQTQIKTATMYFSKKMPISTIMLPKPKSHGQISLQPFSKEPFTKTNKNKTNKRSVPIKRIYSKNSWIHSLTYCKNKSTESPNTMDKKNSNSYFKPSWNKSLFT